MLRAPHRTTSRAANRPRLAASRAARMAITAAVLLPGCKEGSPPTLLDPRDQVAVVGQQLVVQLVATDPDGDALSFAVAAPSVPDLESTIAITTSPAGQGVFAFTPLASQIGLHAFDFSVSDGRFRHTLTVDIDVRGAVGSGSTPVFRKPLGAGTVLDLEQVECLDVEVEVRDPDSTSIELAQAPPLIDGAALQSAPDGLSGSWQWCPSRSQAEADDRYYLTLLADDGDNPPVTKDFAVVLRRRSGQDCPGKAPLILHEPMDFTTKLDLPIIASIEDDLGLGSTPYVVYATEDPGDPIDFTKTTLASMELIDGDMRSGTWQAMVPNFLADQAEGTTAPLFYLISASDDDDADGDCDHRSDAPAAGTHRIEVTVGGSEVGLPCDSCSFDVQCGDADDLCLPTGSDSGVCGRGCSGDGECDEGYVCSPQPVESVQGQAARQCIPNTGQCGSSGGTCEDDDHEPDSTVAQGLAQPELTGNLGGRVLCEDDDDWYAVVLDEEARIEAGLQGDSPPDIDLSLSTAAGVFVDSSTSLSSSESLSSDCLDPGTYLLRVYSIDSDPAGSYSLSLNIDADDCGGPVGGVGDCCIDNNSPGCEVPAVQACVCALDAYCCATEWDDVCAGLAANDCDGCGPPNEDCCTVQASPGCTDPGIQACVCAEDPYCCSTQWDGVCVGLVGSTLCDSACVPDDADGPCCAANGTPGCEVDSVETCVCTADPFCCDTEWDAMCVDTIATSGCGTCPA
ncbi:MAG: hypothetical protein AB1Z98_37545 [Nannocystaceae bacterium]